jgi:hypothetical protein
MNVSSPRTETHRPPSQHSGEEERDGDGGREPPARPRGARARRKIVITIAVGLTLIVGAMGVALTQAPSRVVHIGYPGIKAVVNTGVRTIGYGWGAPTICQSGETLPAGITAVRLSIWAFFGPPVHVTAYRGGELLTEGSRDGGWVSDSVTVPLKPLTHAVSGVKLCAALRPNAEQLLILGAYTSHSRAATLEEPGATFGGGSKSARLEGRLTAEYLRSGSGSWLSRIVAVARRAGLGRAFSGTWIALMIAALMLAVGALALGVTLREQP